MGLGQLVKTGFLAVALASCSGEDSSPGSSGNLCGEDRMPNPSGPGCVPKPEDAGSYGSSRSEDTYTTTDVSSRDTSSDTGYSGDLEIAGDYHDQSGIVSWIRNDDWRIVTTSGDIITYQIHTFDNREDYLVLEASSETSVPGMVGNFHRVDWINSDSLYVCFSPKESNFEDANNQSRPYSGDPQNTGCSLGDFVGTIPWTRLIPE